MDLNTQLFVFITALFSALLMVPLLLRWALDRKEVDVPDARKVHCQATPRIGGFAISLAFTFAVLSFVEISTEIRGLLAGTMVIFLTGLVDDLHGMSARRKLLGQVAACLVTMMVGGISIQYLGNIFGFGEIILPLWLGVPFTILGVIGLINAINLIDGLDGLAGGLTVIALSAFFILAWIDGNATVAVLSAGLLGALLGFMKYNFYPARIFMGDTGSLTLGFVLAFLAILLTQPPEAQISPVIPVIILGLPIIDTLWVMGRRLTKGQNPFYPDMSHVHHKFLDLGFQHRFTVLLIYTISLFWAVVSVLFPQLPAFVLLWTFVGVSAVNYGILRYIINRRERFGVLSHDSAAGIRESELYHRLVGYVERATPLVMVLAGLVLLATGWFAVDIQTGFWQISGVIFLASLGLIIQSRNPASEFLLAMLFFGALVVAFVVQSNAGQVVVDGLTLGHLINALLIPLALVILLRHVFRRRGEFFLNTVDYLVIGVAIFVAIFLYQIDPAGPLSAALPKGVVLFLAIKMIAKQGRREATFAVGALLAMLLLITIRNFPVPF